MKGSARRAFVVVLDACGVGALPDASAYGDRGCDTLGHLAELVGGLRLPALQGLGLGDAHPLAGVERVDAPVLHGRLAPQGVGKDSAAGHWELMGCVCRESLPTFPDGFPVQVNALIEQLSGRRVICNLPYNGLEAIEHFGAEHVRTGALIVYTSQDSVLQVAAHADVVAVDELYEICCGVRRSLPAEHQVGRVIARPFRGDDGAYERTDGRRDFAIAPPGRTYLEELCERDVPVHAVGKVDALFSGRGITQAHPAPTNQQGLKRTAELLLDLKEGLVFTNLIETDQVYGHRHDADGFHQALRRIDAALQGWLRHLRSEDLLVLTADHGCDVTAAHTDHTREYVPLLASFAGHGSRRHDGEMSDVGASVLRWLTGEQAAGIPGSPFV